RLHVLGPLELVEQVAQLGVAVEGQRVLALGAVQGDGRDAVLHFPQEVRGPVAGHRAAVAGQQGGVDAVVGHLPCLRCVMWVSWAAASISTWRCTRCTRRRPRCSYSASLLPGARPVNISVSHFSCSAAIRANSARPLSVRLTRQERRSSGSSTRCTRPSLTSWSVRPVTLPPVTIR